MKVIIDHVACTGHGRCYTLVPALFDSDDEGHSVLLVEGDLAESQRQEALTAAANCPERAITVTD